MTGGPPWPLELRVQGAGLDIDFDDGSRFSLPVSLLRAMTPSAAARGHGAAPGPLAEAFDAVRLLRAERVGAYAVRLVFDDGHDTGLYTWAALHALGLNKAAVLLQHQSLLNRR